MGNIKKIISSRRTTHTFLNKKIDEAFLLDCMEASLNAPNHKLTQPVRYYLAGEQTREMVFDFLVETKQKKSGPLNESQKESFKNKFINPSHLIIVSQVLNSDPIVLKEDYATLACTLHNLALLLWEEGIGTKWSTGNKIKSSKLHDITNIDARKESIEALFWVGVPKIIPSAPPRGSLDQFLKRLK